MAGLKLVPKSDQSDYEIQTPTLAARALAATLDKTRDVKIITGSQDVTSASGDLDINITAVTGIKRIRRAWFWISERLKPDVGINTNQPIKLLFFAKDTFLHTVDDVDPNNDGLVLELVEFHFVVQDLETAIVITTADVNVDDTTLFAAGLLIRIVKSTNHEFQRILTKDDATDMTIEDLTKRAYALNDDVALVLEVGSFEYEDKDGTGEIHMRISPGDTGGDDFRLHWAIEYEAKQT